MKQNLILPILLVVLIIGTGIAYAYGVFDSREDGGTHTHDDGVVHDDHGDGAHSDNGSEESPAVTVVKSGLEIPWDIAFLPDETMLVTERPGRLVHIEEDRTIEVDGVEHTGEGGLLGIALHPDFESNRYVYLYQTTRTDEGLENQVNRYTYEDNELTFDQVIVEGIAGAPYHDGGRIEFGPEGYLWVATGDATVESNAQNPGTLAGGILRLNPDGSAPEDSQYSNGVYSYGHRNPQGLAWDEQGRLWSTEHGRSGLRSGMDEVNLIQAGANYGWPDSEGDTVQEGTVGPKAHSGPDVTWAPASAVYWDGSIFFGGLRGAAVYEAVLDGEEVTDIRRYFHNDFGRIRTIRIGPDGMMYLTTSNRDGRGDPAASDDRIIRIDPEQVFR